VSEETNDPSVSPTPDASAIDIEKVRADLERVQRDYLYLRADFDNYKKGAIKERSDLIKYGNERLLVEILGIVDTFQQALATDITPDNVNTFKAGVEMIAKEVQALLSRMGVQKIESTGQPFDPILHEAISSEPTVDTPAGHITRVFKPAYKLHDKVIRTGQVVVAREPETKEDEKG